MNLSDLYNDYEKLSGAKDKNKISECEKEFMHAINAAQGGEQEKKLAAQIISQYFKYFPTLQQDAMNAIIDLCEDDTTLIRIASMKTLPLICKDSPNYVSRVADILAQLLQLEDPQEYNVACSTLLNVLNDNPGSVIKTMFGIINDEATDGLLREKCIKFLMTKLKLLDKQTITPEIQDIIIKEIKISIKHCVAQEFILLMNYLVNTKYMQSINNQQKLIEIISKKLSLDQPFIFYDTNNNNLDKLFTCVKFIIPYFSSKQESTKFVVYYCDQVLPYWIRIGALNNGSKYQLAIAQQLAELSQYCGQLESPQVQIDIVFQTLKSQMPKPPADPTSTNLPYFNFSLVEALLFTFYRLARQQPDFIKQDQLILKDFRSRLMYFSRGVQGCLKVLSDKEKVYSKEEKKMRDLSPKILNNINLLIRDLFCSAPTYKATIVLSFKTEEKTPAKPETPEKTPLASKRHAPIVYENNGSTGNKHPRQNRAILNEKKIYTPPRGTFSYNFHNNDRNSRFRGNRGSIRGGLRSRGRGGYRN